jgi:hypothetical protein
VSAPYAPDFSLLHIIHIGSEAYPASYSMYTMSSSPEDKAVGA